MNIVLSEPDTSFKMNSEEGKMFVGGIKQDTTDEDFKEYFSKYGELTDCVLMKDQNTNRPRGFGFIRYKDQDDVRKVLEDSPHFLKGKRIDPKQCLPRNVSREMSRSGGGGIMGSGDAPLSQKIFIGGVGQTSEEDIQTEFGKYGNVLEVVLMMDKVTGNCRGFGFVTFDNEQTVNQLCERRYVTILEKRVEIKRAQPRDAQGGPPGGRIFNAGPMNQGGPPMGQGGPPMGAGGPPAGWNQGQGPGGWNQNQAASYGGAQPGGFNQQNNFGGGWNQPQQPPMGNFGQQGGPPGGFGGQQQQQAQGPAGQYGNYNNQNQGQGGNTYGQTPQNYGGNYGGGQQQQAQQQQQPNNYGQPQQNYGNWQPQQQQQPNMYGNQGGGDGQAYGGQQNYGNPQQPQQQGNMGNYAQEASGYGPQRVNYNNAAGYNQPGQQGAYGQAMAGNYNGQQQQQQQQQQQPAPMQQQQQQPRPPMQQQQQGMQQQQTPQQGNYGQPPGGMGGAPPGAPGAPGTPGANYQQRAGGAVQQAQQFHPYRR